MFKRVLLSTDGSEHAQAAADLVLRLQWCPETSFELVAVADKQLGIGHLDAEEARQLIGNLSQKFVERFGGATVTGTVENGNAHDTIAKKVDSLQPDLVVIGAHSRHGLLIGNVMKRLVHDTRTNLLVARAPGTAPETPKVILCLGNAKTSEAVLTAMEGFEWRPDAQIMILHVFAPPDTEYTPSPDRDRKLFGDAQKEAARTTEEFLDKCKARLAERLKISNIRTHKSEDMTAAESILAACDEWGATMVVLGPRQTSASDELLLGSTATQVCASAPCHVLIIRNPDTAASQCGVTHG